MKDILVIEIGMYLAPDTIEGIRREFSAQINNGELVILHGGATLKHIQVADDFEVQIATPLEAGR